jgi:hypothetical protein
MLNVSDELEDPYSTPTQNIRPLVWPSSSHEEANPQSDQKDPNPYDLPKEEPDPYDMIDDESDQEIDKDPYDKIQSTDKLAHTTLYKHVGSQDEVPSEVGPEVSIRGNQSVLGRIHTFFRKTIRSPNHSEPEEVYDDVYHDIHVSTQFMLIRVQIPSS